jgi:hypothetical protein
MIDSSRIPKIPAFTLPALIARVGKRLPQFPHSVNLALALNAARRMGVLPEETLAEIEGKRFRVTVLDTGMVADFCYRDGAFRPLWNTAGQPDLQFAGLLVRLPADGQPPGRPGHAVLQPQPLDRRRHRAGPARQEHARRPRMAATVLAGPAANLPRPRLNRARLR